MKKKLLLPLMLIGLFCLSGCHTMPRDPLQAAVVTLVPDSGTKVHSPIAQPGTGDSYQAVLYFRFLQEELLAQESRRLTVPKDSSVEKTIVQALIQGPSTASPELRRLFSSQVQVLSTVSQGSTLFVTLNESILSEPVENRVLQMQSLAATLVENLGYETVQVLVDQKSAVTTSLRLSNAFFNPGSDGAAAPLYRDERYLLSPKRTLEIICKAWREKDFERLYQFIAIDNNTRPFLQEAVAEIDNGFSLTSFSIGAGTVFPNGSCAIVNCDFILADVQGNTRVLTHYPFRLIRENDVWKMQYEPFLALVNHQ